MAWNEQRYQEMKRKIKENLDSGYKKPYDYMQEYKLMVEKEDYESCKAITEMLAPLNYHTADTHNHIKSLTP